MNRLQTLSWSKKARCARKSRPSYTPQRGEWVRSFAADAHDCITWTYRIQGCGAIEPRPKAGSPLIVISTAPSGAIVREAVKV